MKKLLLIVMLCISGSAIAQHNHHHGHWQRGHGGSGWNWVAPIILGGVIGYEISRNQPPVIVQQPLPIIVRQEYSFHQQNCSPWTEIQNSDGTITRTRTCTQ